MPLPAPGPSVVITDTDPQPTMSGQDEPHSGHPDDFQPITPDVPWALDPVPPGEPEG